MRIVILTYESLFSNLMTERLLKEFPGQVVGIVRSEVAIAGKSTWQSLWFLLTKTGLGFAGFFMMAAIGLIIAIYMSLYKIGVMPAVVLALAAPVLPLAALLAELQATMHGQHVSGLAASNLLAKVVIPFVRTPINLMKFATERSPAAPLLSPLNLTSRVIGMGHSVPSASRMSSRTDS